MDGCFGEYRISAAASCAKLHTFMHVHILEMA